MKPKLLVVYVALIVLPLAILGWLGARAIGQERNASDRNIEGLLKDQLLGSTIEVQRMMDAWTVDWESVEWDVSTAETVRDFVREDGRITQFFCIDGDGALAYPIGNEFATGREREFLARTESVWSSGAIHLNQTAVFSETSVYSWFESERIPSSSVSTPMQGQWYEWYWGDGLQLMYWWVVDDGRIFGVEVDRVRLLAEMIGVLPDTSEDGDGPGIGTRLLNESGHILYQWGNVGEMDIPTASLSIPLSRPLGAWSFNAYMTTFSAGPAWNALMLAAVLASLALLLAGLGIYFYRENTRELREAVQRVSFVNHVSHELKTPLTNIRMYAELLQEQMDPEQEQEASRLGVILSESQRLSRLITNVLTFNRKQRSALTLHPALVNVDELVRQVLSHFEKSFLEHGIRVTVEGGVPDDVNIDGDVFEQIVGNLLSNVEKYARNCGKVRISTAHVQGQIDITVEDGGPGIPATEREAIFPAFYRVDDELTEGVSGTGIGLSIARDLARLHGGDLELAPSETGACFRVRLAVQGELR